MRNYFFLLLILFSSAFSAQSQSNRFSEDEYQTVNTSATADNTQGTGGPGSNDGDKDLEGDDPAAPIDDYIPLLLITGLGIIIYTTHKRKKLQSEFNNH